MNIEVTDAGRNEYEALVRDARRYRWLRDGDTWLCVRKTVKGGNELFSYPLMRGERMDTAIDAAIAAAYKKRQEGK